MNEHTPADDLDTRLTRHLGSRASAAELPDGEIGLVRNRSNRLQRRTTATRTLASIVAAGALVAGVVTVTNGDDDPRSAVDVAGPPGVDDRTTTLDLRPLEVTGLDGDVVFQVVSTADTYYGLAFSPDFESNRLVSSPDGAAWQDVTLPLEGREQVGQVGARDDSVIALATDRGDGSSAAYLRTGGAAWQRIPFRDRQEAQQVSVTVDGTILAVVSVIGDAELDRRADEAAFAEAIAAFGEHDSYSWSSSSGDPLATVVEIMNGTEVIGTPTLRDLGLDEAMADRFVNMPDGYQPSSLLRLDGDSWTELVPPVMGENADLRLAGDMVVANDNSGVSSAHWSVDGSTWTSVPAALGGNQYIDQVLSSDLGTYAAVQGDRSRFFRADTLAGPWSEIDLGTDEPRDAYGTLAVSDGAVVLVVQEFGGLINADSSVQIPDDVLADATATLSKGEYTVEVRLDGPTVVRDSSGAVVLEISSEEFNEGSDRVRVDDVAGTATLTLPSGDVIELGIDEVFAALAESDPQNADLYRSIIDARNGSPATTVVAQSDATASGGGSSGGGSYGGTVSSATAETVVPDTTVYLSTDGKVFSVAETDVAYPAFTLRGRGGLVVGGDPTGANQVDLRRLVL